jgi:hypothetical protein
MMPKGVAGVTLLQNHTEAVVMLDATIAPLD